MCGLITAIHYSNKNELHLALDTNLGTEDVFAKDKACVPS